jgi:hypothetical protein
MKLTNRGLMVMTVVWTAFIAALIIWWGHVVAQHDRATLQACQVNAYDCNHLDPDWFKHGEK